MPVSSPKVYRGSKKRLRRIRMRDNGSLAFWMFVAVVLFSLFVVLSWLILHEAPEPPAHGTTIQAR